MGDIGRRISCAKFLGMNSLDKPGPLSQPKPWAATGLIVFACLVPTHASADSKQSATHAMQWEDGQTIHLAKQGGAINRHRSVKIEVEVFSSKRVLVTDSGSRSEHNLYPSYSTDDSTTWVNLWQGTWSFTGDLMKIELTLHDRKCTRQKKMSDAAAQTLPCGAVSKQLALSCKLAQVTIQDLSGAAPLSTAVPVWTCLPTAPADLADTPVSWVLGKASCVKVLAGPSGLDYQKCALP